MTMAGIAMRQTERKTVDELLKNSAARFGDRVALQMKKGDSYETLTYAELAFRSRNLSSFLTGFGIRKGDRVAILSENRPEWAIVYFGILGCGGVVVGVDPKLAPGETGHILSHSQAKLLFASSQCAGYQFDQRVISVDEDIFRKAISRTEVWAEPRSHPADLAMLVYTSGTTGAPKAVMLTHGNIVSNVLAAYEVLPAKSTDNFLSVLPLSHMFELVGGLLGPLYCGANVTYVPILSSAVLRSTMKETQTTVMQGAPLLFKLFYKGIMRTVEESIQPIPLIFSFNMNLARAFAPLHIGKILFRRVRKEFGGHIKYFVSGGAALEPEVALAFRSIGMPILEGYGLTETSPIVGVNTPKAHRIGSVGKPLPGVGVRISDEGEIAVRGPNVMKGYYGDTEATAAVLRNQELYTGDIGFLDRDGFLHVTGRKKSVIVTSAGRNIYPEEIEAVLGRSPYISELCVVPRKGKSGERPFIFIIPDYDHFARSGMSRDDSSVRKVLDEEIRSLSRDLAEYKRISDFAIFKGEFPKTAMRKIKRHELQQILGESRTEVEAEELVDDSTRRLRGVVAEIAEIPQGMIRLDSDLNMDLGVDSLLKVEILTAVERECGVHIPDELAHRVQTFRDVVEFVRKAEHGQIPAAIAVEEEDEGYDFLKERSALRQFIKSSLSFSLRIFSKWYFSLEVKNLENIAGLESFIITPNHNSLLDVPIVLSSLPRRTAENMFSPAAKDYFFDRHPVRRWFIRLAFETFPFDRHGDFMKGLKKCRRTIEEGKSLILFPEGTRSISGELQPFKVGLGAVALELNIPVVPTYVKGIHKAFGKGMLFPKPNKIEVRFGKPLSLDPYRAKSEELSNYEIYKEIIVDVRKEILRLM